MKILVISGHVYKSPRQAGFHFLSRAFFKGDNSVRFMTVGVSYFSILRKDPRIKVIKNQQGINRWVVNDDGIASYVFFTPWHPVRLRSKILDQASSFLFSRYGRFAERISSEILAADMIIVECGVGLMLLNYYSESLLERRTRVVYRVSDDLTFLKVNPVIRQAEIEFLQSGLACLVSCPVESIADRLKAHHNNVHVHQHGLDTQVYDSCSLNPYAADTVNAIFVGLSHFDGDVLHYLVDHFTSVNFHVFGVDVNFTAPNLYQYGEVPFLQTIPYVKYASVGLQIRFSGQDLSLKHSLKVQQYSYCGLPIVGPASLDSGWGNYYGYDRDNEGSILNAFQTAIEGGQCVGSRKFVRTWHQVVDEIISMSSN